MKSVAVFACLILAVLPAQAQIEQYDAGMFFDPQGTQLTINVAGFEDFNLYVVAFDLDGDVFGYEGFIESSHLWAHQDPLGPAVLQMTMAGPNPLNVGNFVVGTGGCIPDEPGPLVLVNLWMRYLNASAPSDNVFCLTFHNPTSFSPAAPGYMRCSGELVPFGTVPPPYPGVGESCAVVNPTTVSTTSTSVGALKARF